MNRLREENNNSEEFWSKHWTELPPWRFGIDVWTARLELFAANIKEGETVLDVGGARGEIAEWIKRRVPCDITVADLSPAAVAISNARGIPAVVCDCTRLGDYFSPDSFDVVMSGETLEHMEDPAKLIHEMVQICKVGGLVQLSTPFEAQWNHDEHHVWAFTIQDVVGFLSPYGPTQACKVEGDMIVASCRIALKNT